MFNSVGENRQLVQVTGGSSHFQVSKRQKCIIDNSIKKSNVVLREFTAKQTISKWLEITWTLSSSTKGKHVIVKACIEWEFCQVRDVNKICKWHEIVGKITLRELARPLKVGSNLKLFPRRSQTRGNEIYNSWLQNNVHWHSSILSPGSFWLLVSGMVAKLWTLGEWINSIFWLVDRKTIASTQGVRCTEGIDRAGNRTLITINLNFFMVLIVVVLFWCGSFHL